MKKVLLGLALVVSLAAPTAAQSPVKTQPLAVASTTIGSTIVASNTFQQLWPSSAGQTRGRIGCMVANHGAATMYLYFGAAAGATTPKSIPIAAGAIWYCNWGGIVVQDELSITGTAGQYFTGVQQ